MRKCVLAFILLIIAPKVLAARAKGIDAYSGDGAITWSSVKAAGYTFAWVKADEGLTFHDTSLNTNMTNGKAAGMMISAYHYARPENNTAIAEANSFYTNISSWLTPAYMRPALDLESGGGTLTNAALTQWCVDFMTQFKARSGITPILYTGHNYAKYYETSAINQYDIWYANYNGADSQTGGPTISDTVANHWNFWQYSSSVTVPGVGGGTAGVDVSVANGDVNYVRGFMIPEPASATLICLTLTFATFNRRRKYH